MLATLSSQTEFSFFLSFDVCPGPWGCARFPEERKEWVMGQTPGLVGMIEMYQTHIYLFYQMWAKQNFFYQEEDSVFERGGFRR